MMDLCSLKASFLAVIAHLAQRLLPQTLCECIDVIGQFGPHIENLVAAIMAEGAVAFIALAAACLL